jgi:hypothetical protein
MRATTENGVIPVMSYCAHPKKCSYPRPDDCARFDRMYYEQIIACVKIAKAINNSNSFVFP